MSSTTTATRPPNVADDVGDLGDVGLGPSLEDDRERAVQAFGEELRSVHAAGVRRNDDDLVVAEPFLLEVVAEHRHRHQIVDRNVEEALNLRGVQIHRDDAARAGDFEEVRDHLGRDRLATFRLLILLGVSVVGNHRGDARGGGSAQRVDHQQQLHHRVVDALTVGRSTDRLDDEDFGAADVLADLDPRLFVPELGNERLADVEPQALGDLFGQLRIGVSTEEKRLLAHGRCVRSPLNRSALGGCLRKGSGSRFHARLALCAGGRSTQGDRGARPRASCGATALRRCSASPEAARRWRWRARSSSCGSRRSCSATTRRSPPSSAPSFASSSRITRSSTSFRTSTTTSPKRTCRRPTRISRRTARSTTRSSACATRRRSRC